MGSGQLNHYVSSSLNFECGLKDNNISFFINQCNELDFLQSKSENLLQLNLKQRTIMSVLRISKQIGYHGPFFIMKEGTLMTVSQVLARKEFTHLCHSTEEYSYFSTTY